MEVPRVMGTVRGNMGTVLEHVLLSEVVHWVLERHSSPTTRWPPSISSLLASGASGATLLPQANLVRIDNSPASPYADAACLPRFAGTTIWHFPVRAEDELRRPEVAGRVDFHCGS